MLQKACHSDGVAVVDHFCDDGFSAKTFKRPSFEKMLARLKNGSLRFDYLYVVKWDRFSRNIENSYLMIRELRSFGVKVICLEESLDESDPASVLLRAIKLAEPEMDNRRRAMNTRMGIRKALKDGRYATGAAPLGYSWDRNRAKPMIVPNESALLVREAFEMYATGLYSIEFVRKEMCKKGLKIGKTSFNQLLRKPIYAGKIVVPAFEEEEEQIVQGIHEAIVDEELFQKTQRVLTKVLERNASRVDKIRYNPELPLRGFLECPSCGTAWTGSGSRGNGGVYHYYHCQNGCTARAKAAEANIAFVDYLKTFKVNPPVLQLYEAVMEDIFKSKEGDREQQLQQLERTIEKVNQKLLKIDEKYLEGELEKDSYQRLKKSTKEEEARLQQKHTQLELTDTNYMRYCKFGLSLLANIDMFYLEAEPHVQKKLLGSIFTEKLVFEDGKYRTNGVNPAVELIGLFQKGLGNKKNRTLTHF